MDDCCAPQWTDFTSSPQLPSDSYFDVEHEVHAASTKWIIPITNKGKIGLEAEIKNIRPVCVSTPIQQPTDKVGFFIPFGNQTEDVDQPTTLDSLPERVKNIQLCFKERRLSNLESFKQQKTPSTVQRAKSVTSEKTLAKATPVLKINKTISGDFPSNFFIKQSDKDTVQHKETIPVNNQGEEAIKLDVITSPKVIKEIVNKRLSYKVIRRKSNGFIRHRRSLGKSQPRVLTSQFRRRSLNKYRRRTNEYISLAESVSKFQTSTPDRFRTISQKVLKPAGVMKMKRSTKKLTFPQSPALRCKQRARRIVVQTKEEREQQELEEMKKHQIKANPVPTNILKGPVRLKKVEKKPTTITAEFHLTQVKTKPITTAAQSTTKPSQLVTEKVQLPKIIVSGPNDEEHPVVTGNVDSQKIITNLATHVDEHPSSPKVHSTPTRIRHTTLGTRSSPSKPLEKKNEHRKSTSAIAMSVSSTSSAKNAACTLPFAFENRNKEFLLKKEQKLKELQTQENNKIKVEFHARPVPKFKKPSGMQKPHSQVRKSMMPCPFSFETRDKNLAKKKEQQAKHLMEEKEKERHKFHANPVPLFKPVAVSGTSKDIAKCKSKRTQITKHNGCVDQENKQPNIVDPKNVSEYSSAPITKPKVTNKSTTKTTLKSIELNTDKRAKERHGFEEKLKKKMQEDEMKRLEEEKERLEREKKERAELRKMAQVKARPMPVYKPLIILKSSKPPTSPKTPAVARKLKTKIIS